MLRPNTNTNFDLTSFDVERYNTLLSHGLSKGLGLPLPGEMCIEAVICNVMGLEHSDDPMCVADSVRKFKIHLNDKNWSSNVARAKGLHDLGLAQLGSLGTVNDTLFSKKLMEKIIRVLLPNLFRRVFLSDDKCLAAALVCEMEGTGSSARDAAEAAYAVYAAVEAAYATTAAYAVEAATTAAAYVANTANAVPKDYYLNLVATLAVEVLRDLKSPGCTLLP